MVPAGGGLPGSRRLGEGGISPRMWLRGQSGRQDRGFGHVRANRRGGSGFPRMQRIGEPPDVAPGGGEGDFPTGMSGKGLVRAPGTVWRAPIAMDDDAAAPSTTTAKIRTNATHFASERATRDPMVG